MTTEWRTQFERSLKSLAELTGKTHPSETVLNFFWSRLKHVAPEVAGEAFAYFAERGKWPTVGEFLRECGYEPIRGRDEKESDRPIAEPKWPAILKGPLLRERLDAYDVQEICRPAQMIDRCVDEFISNARDVGITLREIRRSDGVMEVLEGKRSKKIRVVTVMLEKPKVEKIEPPPKPIRSMAELMAMMPAMMRGGRHADSQ
jgi:hypothetical protein